MKSSRNTLVGVALAVAVVAAVAPVMLTGQDRVSNKGKKAFKDVIREKVQFDPAPVNRAGGIARSYADTVEKVQPSVVSIYTSKTLSTRYNELLWYYGQRLRREDLPKQTGLGSGVIISSDGYILTNNHVVGDADEIKVALADNTEYTAKLVGRDAESEVAVIKIEAKGLPAITVADSQKVKVGDVVLAFGNPFGLEQTVSMGIVSGTGRKNVGIARYGDFIQTDASINPGNSGGALVDADGRLIGVNTAIFTQTGGSVGIGFAIPTKLAMNVVDDLVADGKVTRGFLGITMAEVNEDFATYLNRDNLDGVVVAEVVRNTPAHRAGMRPYDLILEWNGRPAKDVSELSTAISELDPGTEMKFKVLREGKIRMMSAVLAGRDDPYTNYGKPVGRVGSVVLAKGVKVGDLNESVRSRLRLRDGFDAIVVTDVTREAPRKNARLSPGDLIIEIDRKPVSSVDEVKRLKEAGLGTRFLVRVISAGDGETRLYVLDS